MHSDASCGDSHIQIPKPNKDNVVEGNYGAISLKNIDIKILSKLLANRIYQYIKRNMQRDQMGFISEMRFWFNIQKSM